MKITENIPAQTKPKSILDMTPFELAMIDQYQDKNRRFRDEQYFYDEDYVSDWDQL